MGENQSLLARMGGDEFVILAVDAGEHGNDILRNRLHQRVADYNANGSAPCHISLSVGSVSMVPDHTLTIDALIAAADKLMYDSKRQREKS
jgi:diguanylate cyclase (GGDEF)-like protein